jgi:hypothetical protein
MRNPLGGHQPQLRQLSYDLFEAGDRSCRWFSDASCPESNQPST